MSYSAMVHEANVLAARVSQLEQAVPDTYERMLAEAKSLSARVAVLEQSSPPGGLASKRLLTKENLVLVGGYRFPALFNIPELTSSAFTRGGLWVATIDGVLHVGLVNSRSKQMIATTSQAISTDVNPQNWTLLNEHLMLGLEDFWTARDRAAWTDGDFYSRGAGYDTVTGELYSLANSLYYGDDYTNWIARRTAINGGTRDTGFQSNLTNQGFPSASFANSISNIPQADADAYFGGRRLLVGGGMFSSGAGQDSYGPAAFFMNDNGVGGTKVLQYQTHGSAGADVQSGAYAKMNQAVDGPSDYWINGIGWYYGPPTQHPPGQPAYKLHGEMHDGPAWIDHPNFRGVCWVMQRSIGELSYAVQTEGGSTDWRGILYIYDPLELAEVFDGTKLPHEPTPIFYEIPSNINGFGVGHSRGCAFDSATGLFYVLHPWGWDIGYGPEKYPVLATYELTS